MGFMNHEDYFYKDNKVPSVTEIIKLLNKPELIDWANYMGMKKVKVSKYVDRAAAVGTYVHYLIEKKCKKKKFIKIHNDLFTDKELDRVINCTRSFGDWDAYYKPKYIKNELRLTSNKFGGTIDCIAEVYGYNYIIDFKTSKNLYKSHLIQLAGYNYLLKKMKCNYKLDYAAILLLNKYKVSWEFCTISIKELENIYEPIFLKLLELYEVLDNVTFTNLTTYRKSI